MKKSIRSIILAVTLLLSGFTASAQATAALNEITKMENVSSIYISKAMLSLMGEDAGDRFNLPITDIASHLKSIEIINIDDKDTVNKAKRLVGQISNDSSLDVFTKIKEDGESITILGKVAGKTVTELILLNEEPTEISIIHITGDIPIEKISELTM